MKEEEEEDKFANEWRKAFEDVEASPSPVVWSEIESSLNGRAISWLKRRALYFIIPLFLIVESATIYSSLYSTQKNKGEGEMAGIENIQSNLSENKSKYSGQQNTNSSQSEGEDGNVNSSQSQDTQSSDNEIDLEKNSNSLKKNDSTLLNNEGQNPPYEKDKRLLKQSSINKNILPISEQENVKNNLSNVNSKDNQPSRIISDIDYLENLSWYYLLDKPLSGLAPDSVTVNTESFLLAKRGRLGIEVMAGIEVMDANLQNDYDGYLSKYLETHELQNVDAQGFFNGLVEREKTKTSYSLAARVMYDLSSRWQLRSGVMYHHWQSVRTTNALFLNAVEDDFYAFTNNLSEGNIENTNFARAITSHPSYDSQNNNRMSLEQFNEGQNATIQNTSHYLKIPLEIGYTFAPQSRLSHTLWLGASMDIFLASRNEESKITQNIKLTAKNPGTYRSISSSLTLRWQSKYQINKHWSFFAEPFFEKGLINYTKSNTYTRLRPQNYGVGIGGQFRF
jgi:hypothetical protein